MKFYSSKCFTRLATDKKRNSLRTLEYIKAGETITRFSGPINIENHFITGISENEEACMID